MGVRLASGRVKSLPPVTEATFQRQVVSLFTACGWGVYHTYDSRRSNPGYPDLTLWHRKRGVIWLELKSESGRATPVQRTMIDQLNEACARESAWIVRPSDWPFLEGLARGTNVKGTRYGVRADG